MKNFLHSTIFFVKTLVAYGLHYSGMLHLILHYKLHRKAVVLMYHRVLTNQERTNTFSHEAIIVNTKTFEKQLNYLRNHFHVIDGAEFKKKLNEKIQFQSKSCLITFDDGWLDNYKNAYPLLKKNNLPAIIFLSTAFIGTDKIFWQEKLRFQLTQILDKIDHGELKQAVLITLFEKYNLKIHTGHAMNTKIWIDELHERLKLVDALIRTSFLDALSLLIDKDTMPEHSDRFLNWEQVNEMSANNIRFEAHGANHKILTSVPKAECITEMKQSVETLTSKLGSRSTLFSYPNGGYNEEVLEAAVQCDFDSAFSIDKGFVDVETVDKFKIPRINIYEQNSGNIPMFLCTIAGIF